MASAVSFAWWNLENLYDPEGENFRKLPKGEARRWAGYAEVYPKKLSNLASAIKKMNGGKGPDLLGLCEVFERSSLDTLIKKYLTGMGYHVFHHDSPDLRGIDVALLFRPDVLRLDASKTRIHTIMKRVPTRDILDMHFQVKANGAWLAVLGNHWPSRSGGQYESEPYRLMVAENAATIVSQLIEKDRDAKVLLFGDFNDEPFNRSIQEYLLAIRDRQRVLEAKYDRPRGRGPGSRPYLYNATWGSLGLPRAGTFYYSPSPSPWNWLDQVIVSKGLLADDSPLRLDEASVTVFSLPDMKARNGAPKAFRKDAHGTWIEGYSDHFPVVGELIVA